MSANGPGPEWDAECDVRSTGPNLGGWMSNGYVQNVRGHACMIAHIILCGLGLSGVTTAQTKDVSLLVL